MTKSAWDENRDAYFPFFVTFAIYLHVGSADGWAVWLKVLVIAAAVVAFLLYIGWQWNRHHPEDSRT